MQQIEYLAIDAIIPYARNSRTHSDQQIAQIAASIREFGFTNPVLIDAQGGIIAGHGRVMGARQLGLAEVPCLRLGHLSDAQKRAYIIADNKLALNAGWNDEMLALEIKALGELGFDLDLTGFGADEIDELLAEFDATPEGETDADAIPATPTAPVSRPGDVWLLGGHRLMCGDSTNAVDVALLMDGKRAALLHADPPYGMGKEADGVANDNLYASKLDVFQMAWWRAFRPSIDDNGSGYIWGTAPDLWRLWYVGGLSSAERLTLRNEIVWRKNSAQGMKSGTLRSYPPESERCLFYMFGEQGFNNNADNYWNGWEPIRSYLDGEMRGCGWSLKDVNEITETQMGVHWMTKSQWCFITKNHYEKLQKAARDHDAFKRDHDALKRDHDALKRDFYSTWAYFDNTHEAITDVWEYPLVQANERHGHATPKPSAMMQRIMVSSLPKGGLCVEPFSGSGTTLIAAEQTGRRCYAMELSPQYVDVAVLRWQAFTGKTAILESTGQPFRDPRP